MGSRSRLLAIIALVILLLALPGSGLAGNLPSGIFGQSTSGPKGPVPGVVAGPALVPGASVLAVGFGDSGTFDSSTGSSLIWQNTSGVLSTYSSSGVGSVTAAAHLPAGATIWQVDAYGHTSGATTEVFALEDSNSFSGGIGGTVFPTSSSGPGVVQATLSFPSGATLAVGHEWFVNDVSAESASGAFVGAIFQYTLPTVSLVPITPVRVFDSRFARFSGPIRNGIPRTINVKDAINPLTGAVSVANAIPQGAKAVSYNMTVTGTVGGGFIDVLPGASTTVTGSSLNWTASGVTVGNGGLVTLGTGANERQVTLVLTGVSAQVIVDITGYYW